MTDRGTGPAGRSRAAGGEAAGPRPLKEFLRAALGRIGGGVEPASLASLFGQWGAIAGPALAEHVRPVRLEGGTLVVAADHPAWATKARASASGLLAAVAAATGERPQRLDVVVRAGGNAPTGPARRVE